MHGGSRPRKQPNIMSDRVFVDERIVCNYFARNPMYDECHFLCRLQMQHSFFLLIVVTMNTHDMYFVFKWNACGAMGLFTIQKWTIVIRTLTYGMAFDALDEYVYIGKNTIVENLKCFCQMIRKFSNSCTFDNPIKGILRNKLRSILSVGFQGCLHFWTTCIINGRIAQQHGPFNFLIKIIIVLSFEKPSQIRHFGFGMLILVYPMEIMNDLNVLDHSPLVVDWCRQQPCV
jgi:hypothetical protein